MSGTEPAQRLCVLRGGGDLATGVAWRLTRSGFPVVVTELAKPLTVRRRVALSSAVDDGAISVEGMTGRLVADVDEAMQVVGAGDVAVMVSPDLPAFDADVVVDARIAKRNIDTAITDAGLVVGLGPGFTAGLDCDAVVETMRGPRLGRVLWTGSAAADTGTPGRVGGRDVGRVLRAPGSGEVHWVVSIGERVAEGATLGTVAGEAVVAPFAGVVRGLIRSGTTVTESIKIGDVDPRMDVACDEISDKALAVGGGVLEAVMAWPIRSR